MKVNSLRKWNATHRRTPRLQDLQEDEFVEEDKTRSFKEWLLCKRYVLLHAWLQPDHPDPERVQLSALVRELTKCDSWKFWKRVMGCHDVVFFDYCRTPQKGPAGEERNDEEKRLLKNALKGMNVLYSCSLFRVLVIPDVPQGTKYEKRGWCFMELAISTAQNTVVNKSSREVQDVIKKEGLQVLPEEFLEKFEDKVSTYRGDKETTLDIYNAFFELRDMRLTLPLRIVCGVLVISVVISMVVPVMAALSRRVSVTGRVSCVDGP